MAGSVTGLSTGRTVEKVKVQNFIDVFRAGTGEMNPENVRTVEVQGLVDTGATYLCLPPSAIAQLGLPFSHCPEHGGKWMADLY